MKISKVRLNLGEGAFEDSCFNSHINHSKRSLKKVFC